MKKSAKTYIFNLIIPVVALGGITGVITGATVTFYRWCAKHVIVFSELAYSYVREHLWAVLVAIPLLFAVAWGLYMIYKKMPSLSGGGIPETIGILQGIFTFKWLRSLIGTITLSLVSFAVGAPLGNEGPSVQIGTSLGRAVIAPLGKRGEAWARYSMAGGACSGFAAATGAPMSGIMFAIEEMHRRLSPMILLISVVSVSACRVTTEILCPLLGISVDLFPSLEVVSLSVKDSWIPLTVGLILGLFSVGFLALYRLINKFTNKTLARVKNVYKIFAVLAVTFVLGLCSFSFVSTGHELILDLLEEHKLVLTLIVLLVVRTVITLFANSSGLTGGLFLPSLAVSAVASALVGQGMVALLGLDDSYYTVIVLLGMIAGIAGMMNMPLTGIVFAIEAFGCDGNILSVVTAAAVAYAVVELFKARSINDLALDVRVENVRRGRQPVTVQGDVTVRPGAFAIGKEVRDIFWPAGLFVLSVTHTSDAPGGHDGSLEEGDVLHIRYTTWDENATRAELVSIIGDQ